MVKLFSFVLALLALGTHGADVTYQIKVTTGKAAYSGTDANVYVTFYSWDQASSKVQLGTTGDTTLFENGKEDVFTATVTDVYPVTSIKIEEDNTGANADWYLDKIVLVNTATNEACTFAGPIWLGVATGRQLSAILNTSCTVTSTTSTTTTSTTTTTTTTSTAAPTDAGDSGGCAVDLRSYSYDNRPVGERYGFIRVNGKDVLRGGDGTNFMRGIHLVVLDPRTCSTSASQSFETWFPLKVIQLVAYFNSLPTGTIVLGVSFEDPFQSLVALVLAPLKLFGIDVASVGYRGMFAFVLQKGYPARTILEKSVSRASPLTLSVQVSGDGHSVRFDRITQEVAVQPADLSTCSDGSNRWCRGFNN